MNEFQMVSTDELNQIEERHYDPCSMSLLQTTCLSPTAAPVPAILRSATSATVVTTSATSCSTFFFAAFRPSSNSLVTRSPNWRKPLTWRFAPWRQELEAVGRSRDWFQTSPQTLTA